MASRKPGKKALNIDLPEELYDMFAKLCIDAGITKTEGIVRYFKYLQAQHYKHRQVLDEGTKSDFKLHENKPR